MGWAAALAAGYAGTAVVAAPDRPLARWHASGGQALRQAAAAPQLKAALSHPDAAGVGGRLATNLASFVIGRISGASDAARAGMLAPLAEAALEHESLGEVTRQGWHLGVRAPASVTARLAGATAALANGSKAGASTLVTNGWFLAASDPDGLGRAWLATGRPVAGLVEAEVDLPKVLGPGHDAWPAVTLNLFASNNAVRTSAKLSFATPPLGDAGAWKVPDGAIRDPIIRFQAVRGSAPFVSKVGWMAALAGGGAPNQLFGWAQPLNPFRNWVAFPVEKPAQRLQKIYASIRPFFGTTNQPGQYEGRLVITTNHQALAVLGLRACQPALLPYEQAGQPFLIASFAPTLASTNPVPMELLAELNRPSLVAYEWEIAGESFIHWNVLFDFNSMVQRRMPFPVNARARKWFMSIAPSLGNSVTEVFRLSPTDFSFVRKSDIGLDGLEMTLLARWIDAPYDNLKGKFGAPPLPISKP